jgi:hypothetical protein
MLRLIRRGCGLGDDAADLGLELGVKRRNGTGPVVLRMLNSWASLCKGKRRCLVRKSSYKIIIKIHRGLSRMLHWN